MTTLRGEALNNHSWTNRQGYNICKIYYKKKKKKNIKKNLKNKA